MTSIARYSFLLVVVLTGCQASNPSVQVTASDRQRVEDAVSITEFVHRTYIYGIPYEEASEFEAKDVPVLVHMLNDPKEQEHWSNIAVTLCIIGDSDVADTIIEFIEKTPDTRLSGAGSTAKSDAVMALGYLINRTDSRKAMDYLKASLDPESWSMRNVEWESSVQPSRAARDNQLTTMAALGLALSGKPEAGDALRALQRGPQSVTAENFARQSSATIVQALESHAEISELGLRDYYRKHRQ